MHLARPEARTATHSTAQNLPDLRDLFSVKEELSASGFQRSGLGQQRSSADGDNLWKKNIGKMKEKAASCWTPLTALDERSQVTRAPGMPKFAEAFYFYLPDAFASNPEAAPDLLERFGVAGADAVPQPEHLRFFWC